MTKDCETKLAGVFNPFLESARRYKYALQNHIDMPAHMEAYKKAKAALEAFLGSQHGEAICGQIGSANEWAGPIRGYIAQIEAEISALCNNGQQAQNSAGLQLIPTFG